MTKISIITLFPEIFPSLLNFSIMDRAQKKGLVEFEIINLRDFASGEYKQVDDRPYGGGVGMVLKPDVLAKAMKSIISNYPDTKPFVVLTSASGAPFKQSAAKRLSELKHLVIICGHYEGVDQRFIDRYVDEEISIGDYVLTGGELPSLVIVDSIVRLIKGVLLKEEATIEESFSDSSVYDPRSTDNETRSTTHDLLLEYPHFTRPEDFEGVKVPEVLLSGNHQKISEWRQTQALLKTKKVRPDLLKR